MQKAKGKIILGFLTWIGLLLALTSLASQAQTIYLEEGEITPYLELAEEYEKLGKWREAIEQYQFLLKKYPYSVCQIESRRPTLPSTRYVGIKYYYLEKLRQYPPEGLQVYRAMFDTISQALFEHACRERNETILRRIVDEMFFAEYGDEAAYLLAEILAERGELGSALKYWNDILKLYPDTDLPVAAILAQITLVYKRLGEKTLYENTITRLKTMPDNSQIYLRSKESQLKEVIKYIETIPFGTVSMRSPPAESWTTLGGNNAHNLTMISDSTNERIKGRIDIDLVTPEIKTNRALYSRFAISPCIVDGIIYINNGINLRAFDFKTSKLLRAYPPRWEETISYYRNLITSSTLGSSHFVFGCTLNNGILYANFLNGSKRTNSPGISGYFSYLAAIDARTFKEQWSTKYIADDVFSQVNLCSPPLVYDNKVYVAGLKVSGIETQVYLGCFDSRDGYLLWRRFICARTAPAPGRQNYQTVIIPILAESDGLLVCLTNQGALATLNAATGEIIWLVDYLKDEYVPDRKTQQETVISYPIIKGNILVCLPLYGTKIYRFDLDSGRLRWEKRVGRDDTLLGLIDGTLIIQGNNISGVNMVTGKTLWNPKTMLLKNISIYGPGCLSQRYIYLPCANGLMRIDRGTLKVIDNPPIAWLDPKDVAGNILILDKQLIGISPLRISLFTPLEIK